MKFITLLGLLMIMTACTGNEQRSTDELSIVKSKKQDKVSLSGLKVVNCINRGARYTNSDSTDYWLIHIASTITNESAIPIRLQMAFDRAYNYPLVYGEQKFNVFILPKVFASASVKIVADRAWLTDSMQIEIRDYIEKGKETPYSFHTTLEPGEKFVIPIGTQFPVTANCSVIPNVLLLESQITNFQVCENQIPQDELINSGVTLGLKLDFRPGKQSEKCIIIPCGQITYLE